MGDYDSIYGFGALGLDVVPISMDEPEAAASRLERLVSGGYGIIYVTEEAASLLASTIEKYRSRPLPAIVPIPGIKNNTGAGVEAVRKTVEQSVGSDILFGGNQRQSDQQQQQG